MESTATFSTESSTASSTATTTTESSTALSSTASSTFPTTSPTLFYSEYEIGNQKRLSLFQQFHVFEIELSSCFSLEMVQPLDFKQYPSYTKIFAYEILSEPPVHYKNSIETKDDKLLIVLPFKIQKRCVMTYDLKLRHEKKLLVHKQGHKFIDEVLPPSINLTITPISTINASYPLVSNPPVTSSSLYSSLSTVGTATIPSITTSTSTTSSSSCMQTNIHSLPVSSYLPPSMNYQYMTKYSAYYQMGKDEIGGEETAEEETGEETAEEEELQKMMFTTTFSPTHSNPIGIQKPEKFPETFSEKLPEELTEFDLNSINIFAI